MKTATVRLIIDTEIGTLRGHDEKAICKEQILSGKVL